MVTDHFSALRYTLEQARKKSVVTSEFIQKLNSLIVKNTAGTYNTVFGTIDTATGAFRKGNVTAGETYFPNFDKVENLTRNLATDLEKGSGFNLLFKAVRVITSRSDITGLRLGTFPVF